MRTNKAATTTNKVRGAVTAKKENSQEELSFGSVTIKLSNNRKPSVRKNIEAGQRALARAKKAFAQVGINIEAGQGVPLFHADPNNPDILVRTLNGRSHRGTFENGKFKVIRKAHS